MAEPRSAWSDDRLNDLALTVRTLHNLPNRMVEFEQRLKGLEEDTHDCKDGIAALIRRLDHRDRERAIEKDEDRKERRQDRRVFITASAMLLCAIIGAAAAIIAAGAHP